MTSFNALSDMENLRLFLQERIRVVDPSLDTGEGSEIDTAVIQPLLDRLGPDPYDVPVRDFILGRLQVEYPDLVIQDGEPIDDYAIKIMQILLEPFRRQIRQVSINQSLANPELLNDTEADNLAANYFLSRELGGYSVGSARLYFNAPQYVEVSPVNIISTGSGLRFLPVELQSVTADSMLFNIENNLYYFDVIVRAENQGAEYNIDVNNLVSIDDLPSVVKVTNKVKFEDGVVKETTEDFLSRARRSLTEKSLVTSRGIDARLTEVFEPIRLLAVVGMGDVEMERDIIEGASEAAPFAHAIGTNSAAGPSIDLSNIVLPGTGLVATAEAAGIVADDTMTLFDFGTGDVTDYSVLTVAGTVLEVDPNLPHIPANQALSFRKANASITISDIPGGITGGGNIVVEDGQVHIGGALDVYVRAGDPQDRNTIIEGARDDRPLHFGVDLESFGAAAARLTHITDPLVNRCMVVGTDRYGLPLVTNNSVWVLTRDDATDEIPWKPTEADVGRYIQLLGDGTFGIRSVDYDGYWVDGSTTPYTRYRLTILTIGDATTGLVYDEESGAVVTLTPGTTWDTDCRFVDKISRKSVVRDRDGSTIAITPSTPGGVDFSNLGVEIGDSVVIETGDDAGIYSIRRILSWLSTGDSVVLDRELTNSLEPSGTGNGTGLRYRIADELNVDLVSPKVTKIPLPPIFSGGDLNTVAGSNVVTTTETNFLLAGVESGDTLEISTGDNEGTYQVTAVAGLSLTLDGDMVTAAFSLDFQVYRAFPGIERPLVRVKSVELLDSNSQPTGITIPYGNTVDARVLGIFGNRAEGLEVESFTGVTGAGGGTELVRLSDVNRDFVAEGVVAGFRLNVLNTLNAGEYTIASVAAGYVDVEFADDGGLEFRTADTVHYSIGRPSAGFARLYFKEPTSVTIQTGLAGGRIQTDDPTPLGFRFSEVEGYTILPPGGGDSDVLRDLRVIRTEDVGGGDFNTLVEFTDTANPSAFESELQPGAILEAHEELQFRYIKALNATFTWNGTTTVTTPDTSEVAAGHYIQLGSNQWFEISVVTPNTSVSILNPLSLSIPSGATQSSMNATFEQLCVVGMPAGLRTVTGSNLVSVPSGSLIDFTAMDEITTLVGQDLYINSGPDEGVYSIEEVVSAKQIRINTVMTATTATVQAQGGIIPTQSPQRDPYLEPSGSLTDMTDPTNVPGGEAAEFITIYESTRGVDYDGTYEITNIPVTGTVELDIDPTSDIVNPKDLRTLTGASDQNDGALSGAPSTVFNDPNDNLHDAGVKIGDILVVLDGAQAGRYVVRTHPVDAVGGSMTVTALDGTAPGNASGFSFEFEAAGDADPFQVGRFNWVRTTTDSVIEQPFRIHSAVPTEAEVLEVAPTATAKVAPSLCNITGETSCSTSADLSSVNQGDLIEILTGPNAGVYPIQTVSGTYTVDIYSSSNKFTVTESDAAFRVWSGLHGITRTVLVGPHQSFNGQLAPGYQVPYTVRLPNVFRLSSTEMEENEENNLYYADVQVESQGAGDNLNLAEGIRMVVQSGMDVDGYTYAVDNNRLTFSPFEEVSLEFDRRFLPVGNSDSPDNLTEISGRNLKIVYESSTITKLVDDLLRSDFDRPVNADPLARHFLPSFVLVEFSYSGGLSAEEVGQEMEDYINRTGALEPLRVSDLEKIITKKDATYVQHPILLVSITHDIDRNLVVERSEDSLGGSNSVAYNGTGRTSAFFAILGEGLTVERL